MKKNNNKAIEEVKVFNKRKDKKSVNIKANSARNFQIGLLIALLLAIIVMESNIGFTMDVAKAGDKFELNEDTNYDFVIEKKVEATPVEKPTPPEKRVIKKPVITTVIEVAKNTNDKIVETPTVSTTNITPVIAPAKKKVVAPPMGNKNVRNVEFVPTYPGCESLGTNEAKIDCMSSKINRFIGRKFDRERFDYLGEGTLQKIYVQFKIDEDGYVTDIQARAPDKELQEEAMRVIAKLPVMKPGRQGDVNVAVTYSVPITFRVDN